MAYPDKAAKKILFNTYWTSQGWRPSNDRTTPREAFEAAKKAGLMFDKKMHSHDSIIADALAEVCAVTAFQVADAFVASLTSRRLDLRSALGSYAFLRHFPDHTYAENPHLALRNGHCDICGVSAKEKEVDLSALNFGRFKWGGVWHLDPVYAGFDLLLFRQFGHTEPTMADKTMFKSLIDSIANSPDKTTGPQLQNFFPKDLPSSKSERDQITAILGIAGILGTKDHPGFWQSYVRVADREHPNHHFQDMTYPACLWKRSEGINLEALNHWFGHLI